MLKFLNLIFTSLLIFCLSGNAALAYLDPGTGSIIITAIIAMFAAISTKISYFWQIIKNFINKNKNKNKNKIENK